MSKEIILQTRKLVTQYPKADRKALNGIDLEVYKGEFFGLLGPNGSGKTTLISILCGLLKATGGQATLRGHDILKNTSAILPEIGLVPQEIALYPSLSVRQNLQFFGNLYGMKGVALEERIEECLTIAQLQRFQHKAIKTFSGGMKRRANLVASLIHRPNILFLDEPTANVDPQSRNVIFESLKLLIAKGITIIYTTHNLEEAEQLCHRLAIIDEGRVIAQNSPQKLIATTPNCHDLGEVFLHLTGKNLRDEES